ncbi:MAG: hypothetical protein CL944_00715 [Candidatus Diapherotrites archaeon]|uniref:Uncharacterized protein n=1 Tax=Candidatus Iainarchaeum sp. TaxID=3101447 RepID=A0A2D6LP64_9ARCH|nr:hypothetical protein [Candidatus Diapherotrites archaeon]
MAKPNRPGKERRKGKENLELIGEGSVRKRTKLAFRVFYTLFTKTPDGGYSVKFNVTRRKEDFETLKDFVKKHGYEINEKGELSHKGKKRLKQSDLQKLASLTEVFNREHLKTKIPSIFFDAPSKPKFDPRRN